MTRPILALSACLALAVGCKTPSQARGFEGGFSESQVAEDEFEVTFEGNVGVNTEVLKQSLLRRAAEVTLQHGFTHFDVIGERRQSGLGFVLRPGTMGPSRETQSAIRIRCSVGDPGTAGALDARQVLQSPDHPSAPETL